MSHSIIHVEQLATPPSPDDYIKGVSRIAKWGPREAFQANQIGHNYASTAAGELWSGPITKLGGAKRVDRGTAAMEQRMFTKNLVDKMGLGACLRALNVVVEDNKYLEKSVVRVGVPIVSVLRSESMYIWTYDMRTAHTNPQTDIPANHRRIRIPHFFHKLSRHSAEILRHLLCHICRTNLARGSSLDIDLERLSH
jgi:hypothetical protein